MAKITHFIKPLLLLSMSKAIHIYIKFEYAQVETYEQYINFIHHCFYVAETSLNEVKAQAYMNVGSALYSVETNVSYESKHVELLVNSL